MNERMQAEFIHKGCKDRKDAAVALQVYLELCEVKKYWEVEYFYSDSLERLYFTAKKSKNEDASIFVPIAINETLSFTTLQSLCEHLGQKTIYFVIVESDSTCVYYRITNKLGEVPATVAKISTDDHTQKLDSELNKSRTLLEEAAMHGIAITLPRKSKKETDLL